MPDPMPRKITAPNAFGVTESPRSIPPLSTSNRHAGMTKISAPICVTEATASGIDAATDAADERCVDGERDHGAEQQDDRQHRRRARVLGEHARTRRARR